MPMIVADIISTPTTIPDLNCVCVLEVTYNIISHSSFTQWLLNAANLLSVIADTSEVFSLGSICTRANYLPLPLWVNCLTILTKVLPTPCFPQRNHSSSIEYWCWFFVYHDGRDTTITSDKIPYANTVIFIPSTHDAVVTHTPPPSAVSVISISSTDPAIAYNEIDSKPRIIAAIILSYQSIQQSHAPNYILDPSFSMMEPSPARYASE